MSSANFSSLVFGASLNQTNSVPSVDAAMLGFLLDPLGTALCNTKYVFLPACLVFTLLKRKAIPTQV